MGEESAVEPRLVVVPDVPFSKDSLQGSVGHGAAKRRVDDVAQRRILRGEHADVVTDGDRLRLNRETCQSVPPPLRQHVVEQHGVDAPQQQIAVRMYVVLV